MSGTGRRVNGAGGTVGGAGQAAGGMERRNRPFRSDSRRKRRKARRKIPPAGTPPTVEQLRAELERVKRIQSLLRVIRSFAGMLAAVAAAVVLLTELVMPVFRIQGNSMNPTLSEGDVVIALRGADISQGDLVVFYYENRVLVKRCIAGSGQQVDIDDNGNVYVDGELLNEPYLTEKALGECDIELPCQVPESCFFVMGDHRSVSLDSRSSSVGCVSKGQLAGKIVFRIWPLSGFGTIDEKGW